MLSICKSAKFGIIRVILLFIILTFLASSTLAYASLVDFEVTQTALTNEEPENCDLPTEHSQFTIEDSRAYLWIDWQGYKANTAYRYEWYSPSGTLVYTYENTRSTDSNGCSWSSISSQRLWEHGGGEWSVKFFYDNTLHHTANFVFEDPGEFEYLVYQPDSFVPGNGILIAVHGAGRTVISYYHLFKEMATEQGVLLITPYFSETNWPSYNRIFSTNNPRADTHLQNIIDTVANQTGADKSELYFYGHSGGGQFVHRYMLAHPENIERIVIAAPGYWSFPRDDWEWPYGLGLTSTVPNDVQFDLITVNNVRKKVIVGEDDTERDDQLNQSERADLQGLNRVERSAHWVNQMTAYAFGQGLDHFLRYETIPGVKHNGGWEEKKLITADFFFNDYPAPDIISSMQINNGSETADSLQVDLEFTCQALFGCHQVAIGEKSNNLSSFVPVEWSGEIGSVQTATVKYTLSVDDGPRTIFAQVMDQNGNSSDLFADVIELDIDVFRLYLPVILRF